MVVDALFGYSFKGAIREPYDVIIEKMKAVEKKVLSVDVPSGWDVEKGNIQNSFTPASCISLMLPKLGMAGYKGRHFVGGRFMPEIVLRKYCLSQPEYPGDDLFFEI